MGPRSSKTAAPAIENWGRLAYTEALRRQEDLFDARLAGSCGDVIVCVEHPPTITLGRHAPESDILGDAEILYRRGVAVLRTDRGGRATYHGPGQAVVYPIVDIGALGLGARDWVAALEGMIIEVLDEYGIEGARHPGDPGIWAAGGKTASIGLRIRHGISTHGLAVNVNLDVRAFDDIVVCGAAGQAVTTMSAECGCEVDQAQVSALLCRKLLALIERFT